MVLYRVNLYNSIVILDVLVKQKITFSPYVCPGQHIVAGWENEPLFSAQKAAVFHHHLFQREPCPVTSVSK